MGESSYGQLEFQPLNVQKLHLLHKVFGDTTVNGAGKTATWRQLDGRSDAKKDYMTPPSSVAPFKLEPNLIAPDKQILSDPQERSECAWLTQYQMMTFVQVYINQPLRGRVLPTLWGFISEW